jgi:hypothetical protein
MHPRSAVAYRARARDHTTRRSLSQANSYLSLLVRFDNDRQGNGVQYVIKQKEGMVLNLEYAKGKGDNEGVL